MRELEFEELGLVSGGTGSPLVMPVVVVHYQGQAVGQSFWQNLEQSLLQADFRPPPGSGALGIIGGVISELIANGIIDFFSQDENKGDAPDPNNVLNFQPGAVDSSWETPDAKYYFDKETNTIWLDSNHNGTVDHKIIQHPNVYEVIKPGQPSVFFPR